jgi:hypothetical protein
VGTEADREDAYVRESAEVLPPVQGVAGLKSALLQRKGTEEAKTDPAPLPLSHPDAQPPDEPGAQG